MTVAEAIISHLRTRSCSQALLTIPAECRPAPGKLLRCRRKNMKSSGLHMSSCDQMYHLFLRENFFIWTLGAMGPASQIPGEVSVCWGLCFVNSRAPCKYTKRGRLPHQGTKIAFPPNFFSHLHPSNVTFPTELHAPCPFPASPYYGENWHSGPCPLCQLAESVEGRCSISDITTKFSLGFPRGALPGPFVQGSWHRSLPWRSVPPLHSPLGRRPGTAGPASGNTLSFPPSRLPLPLPFPRHLTLKSL